jgi:hypothetical protein
MDEVICGRCHNTFLIDNNAPEGVDPSDYIHNQVVAHICGEKKPVLVEINPDDPPPSPIGTGTITDITQGVSDLI